MATEVVDTLPVITVAGTNLHPYVKSIDLPFSRAELDDAVFGNATAIKTKGLKNWSASFSCEQDYADGLFDELANGWVDGDTSLALVIRPRGTGSGEPDYSGTGHAMSYNPFSAAHGDKVMSPLVFAAAGDLTRTEQ